MLHVHRPQARDPRRGMKSKMFSMLRDQVRHAAAQTTPLQESQAIALHLSVPMQHLRLPTARLSGGGTARQRIMQRKRQLRVQNTSDLLRRGAPPAYMQHWKNSVARLVPTFRYLIEGVACVGTHLHAKQIVPISVSLNVHKGAT